MATSLTLRPVPGKPNLLLGSFPLSALGCRAAEFFISGTATGYRADGPLGGDGIWSVKPSGTADFTTRVVVLTPEDPARFNGTVLVEWLNVTGGIDAPAVWITAHREIARAGYAYVAVSAQQVGVSGGASLGLGDMSLKKLDPARYADLHHPGDAFAYDIFSQIGRLVRDRAGEVAIGESPEHVVALGESQSAMFLTSYINAVDPLARVYDGFLVHSRFAPAAPFDGSSVFEDSPSTLAPAVRFRTDLRVPVLNVITETDLFGGPRLGYYQARQPDTERLRTWEIPGAAHADVYTVRVAHIDTGSVAPDDLAAAYAPTRRLLGRTLDHAINFAPQHHYVLQAALAGLSDWVRTGDPAPTAAPMALSHADPPGPVLDAHGLAMGGVRTPWVDVPVARTSGIGDRDDLLAGLFGSGEVFGAAALRRLYPDGLEEYLEKFAAALDGAIDAGFLLPADRSEILKVAAAGFPIG